MSNLINKQMGRKPALTQRQMKFAELYVYNDGEKTQTQCAIEAGYKNRPIQNASDLKDPKKYPLVHQYIEKLRKEVREQHGTDFHRHMNMMGKIRNVSLQDKAYAAASNTEYRRGQAAGLYKTDVVHHHIDKDLSSMSKEELMEYMENKYVNNMKDVTPKEDVIESEEQTDSETYQDKK